MVRVGDEIITRPSFWHHGEDIGDRLGKVIDTGGHILVELYDYYDNPIKCFRSEVEALCKTEDEKLMEEVNIVFDSWGT